MELITNFTRSKPFNLTTSSIQVLELQSLVIMPQHGSVCQTEWIFYHLKGRSKTSFPNIDI